MKITRYFIIVIINIIAAMNDSLVAKSLLEFSWFYIKISITKNVLLNCCFYLRI